MNESSKRVARYLRDARVTELTLTSALRSQIAMTPRGAYRDALETHLSETEAHAKRVKRRLDDLEGRRNPMLAGLGLLEAFTGQLLALSMTPLQLLRGEGGEEKVLDNAKDVAAAEAREIAIYAALAAAARAAGDDATARLATSIRRDEDRMLQRVLDEIPNLARAVIDAEQTGESSYELSETGAADAVRSAGRAADRAIDSGRRRARGAARQTRRVPGVARATGAARGAVASPADLPIADYDSLTAAEIVERLPGLSQVDLGTVEGYERRHEDRSTVKERIASLRGQEPWPGYDELTASEVREALARGDDDLARAVRTYERAHKSRTGVIDAAERELSHA